MEHLRGFDMKEETGNGAKRVECIKNKPVIVENKELLVQRFLSLNFWQVNPILSENFNIADKCATTAFSAKSSF